MDAGLLQPSRRRGRRSRSSTLPGMEPPDYFTTEPPDAEFMTVGELRRYIGELRDRAASTSCRRQVELQRKLAFPFVTLVMTLLAIPFGVSAGRHGALYGIGLGIVIALSYWILISAFVAIGQGRAAAARCSPAGRRTSSSPARRLPVPARQDLTRALDSGAARSPSAPRSDRSPGCRGGRPRAASAPQSAARPFACRPRGSSVRRAATNVPSPRRT